MKRLSIILALGLPGSALAAPATLCAPGETVVYSCSTGSRLLSICAGGDILHGHGTMQYRFGTKAKLELVYPDAPEPPQKRFAPGVLSFSGGGGAYLQFNKAGFTYTVFDAIGNWGKSGKGTARGVAVQNNGKSIANIACRTDANYVPGELGPDFFEKAKLGEPASDFGIPEAFFPK